MKCKMIKNCTYNIKSTYLYDLEIYSKSIKESFLEVLRKQSNLTTILNEINDNRIIREITQIYNKTKSIFNDILINLSTLNKLIDDLDCICSENIK